MTIVIRKKNKRLNIKDWNHGDKNNMAAESSGFSLFSADAFWKQEFLNLLFSPAHLLGSFRTGNQSNWNFFFSMYLRKFYNKNKHAFVTLFSDTVIQK